MSTRPPWTTADIPNLAGKIALVTGATAGLGYETALALAQAGATVIVGGRNSEKAESVLQKIRTLCPSAKVEFGKIDHCSLASVSEFASKIATKYSCLDILINNAGIGPPPIREVTEDGFEITFATNHLSHFALTAQLLPLLRKSKSKSSRVVNVGSLAHRKGKLDFENLQSETGPYGANVYAQSKIANLLFTFELQRQSEAKGWGVSSIAAHPGIALTESPGKGQRGLMLWLVTYVVRPLAGQSAAAGALPQLFAATSAEAGGGSYYGPDGFYETKGNVGDAYVLPEAQDMEAAKKLWEISEKLTGVKWP